MKKPDDLDTRLKIAKSKLEDGEIKTNGKATITEHWDLIQIGL